MRKLLQNKFVLSAEGADNMFQAIIRSAILNLVNILPITLLFFFLTDALSKYLFKSVDEISMTKYYIMIPVILLLMYIVNSAQYNSLYVTTYTETAKKRIELSKRIAELPLSFFSGRDLSDLTKTIMSDMETLEHAYSHAVAQFYGNLLSTIVIGIMIAVQNIYMFFAMLWPFPVVLFLIFLVRDKKYKVAKKHADSTLVVSDKIQEMLDNLLAIRVYKRTEKTISEFEQALDREEEAHIQAEKYTPLLLTPLISIIRLGMVSTILVGFQQFTAGAIDLTKLIIFFMVTVIMYIPMESNTIFLIEFIYAAIPMNRMKELMTQEIMTGEDIPVERYDLEVDHVSFAYEDESVIRDVSFTAKQGEVTALVGHSGCGKTTLTSLMLRFYDVDEGEIRLGGRNIKEFHPDSLLKNYSMVFQDVVLFNNTVMENIRIGRKDASDEEVLEAAKIAQVDDFARKLPQGYHTKIGEMGLLLSGGERQRISIARAILKDAPIIFLDESTASVDADSETKIQQAISRLIQDKTVIIIAHRLRTVMNADKILVFEEGKLVEEGNATQLLQQKGAFYKIYTLQQN